MAYLQKVTSPCRRASGACGDARPLTQRRTTDHGDVDEPGPCIVHGEHRDAPDPTGLGARTGPPRLLFSAAPHGVSAAMIDKLLTAAEQSGTQPRVVDISADFRFRTAAAYEAVYKHPHGAPARIAQFSCAVPEHLNTLHTPHVAHPGCFATALQLARAARKAACCIAFSVRPAAGSLSGE